MKVWDTSRIPKTVVRQASPTVKPVEAHLTLSCRCIYVIFFGPKGHFVMNKYLCYWTLHLFIILLLYVWFEHLGHTYGGFIPSFSERSVTRIKYIFWKQKYSTNQECNIVLEMSTSRMAHAKREREIHLQNNIKVKPEQIKLSKTDPSTWPQTADS
jgi:hypothetical protein